MIELKKIDHVGLRVSDKDAARKFYEKLGFEFITDLGFGNGQSVIMRHASGFYLDLSGPSAQSEVKNILMDGAPSHTGITHIAFAVDSIEDTIKLLEAKGIKIGGGPIKYPPSDGRTAFLVRDPDRNVIEFVHRSIDRPVSRIE